MKYDRRFQGALAAMLLLLATTAGYAQYRQGGPRSSANVSAPPLTGLIITFHGKMKDLSKKSILVQADDDRLMTFRRDKKTKFFDGNEPILSTDIDLETGVTVFATEDKDLKLMAVALRIDPDQKKRAPKSR